MKIRLLTKRNQGILHFLLQKANLPFHPQILRAAEMRASASSLSHLSNFFQPNSKLQQLAISNCQIYSAHFFL